MIMIRVLLSVRVKLLGSYCMFFHTFCLFKIRLFDFGSSVSESSITTVHVLEGSAGTQNFPVSHELFSLKQADS